MRRGTLVMIVGLFVLLAVAAFAQYRIGQRDVRIPVTVPGTPSASMAPTTASP